MNLADIKMIDNDEIAEDDDDGDDSDDEITS